MTIAKVGATLESSFSAGERKLVNYFAVSLSLAAALPHFALQSQERLDAGDALLHTHRARVGLPAGRSFNDADDGTRVNPQPKQQKSKCRKHDTVDP